MRAICFTGVLLLGGAVLVTSCAGAEPEETATVSSQRLEAYREPDSEVYVVEGDLAFDGASALRAYLEPSEGPGLVVGCPEGVIVKWTPSEARDLRYCVSTAFGARHAVVVNALNQAAAAWEAAANVDFIHASSFDGACTASQAGVIFDVRPVNGAAYYARAFFPNAARSARNVLIDTTAFGSIAPYTLAGLLRHELGHVLGFLHEPSATCPGQANTCPLTDPDPASVMHYPGCGRIAGDLVLSRLDAQAAGFLYP
ncbi:hypothetical protein VZQ01_43375 [Myxococcus faecalis]|jgi:hypothetical protein|uniref:hypothetical protein n=1 Tax=Myxococcus TaxID=32 RepID=UPI001CBDE751|nr:hypothetical protein [Myxococcus sp. XM-1-1-1]MBZ4413494.1 hypothetical protein [Myxococcus sp. XM-1-1-1]